MHKLKDVSKSEIIIKFIMSEISATYMLFLFWVVNYSIIASGDLEHQQWYSIEMDLESKFLHRFLRKLIMCKNVVVVGTIKRILKSLNRFQNLFKTY